MALAQTINATLNLKLSNPDIHFFTSGQAITQDIM